MNGELKENTNIITLEFLNVLEKINYPEFGVIGQEAGTNRFIIDRYLNISYDFANVNKKQDVL
jgi:hypothetical protein